MAWFAILLLQVALFIVTGLVWQGVIGAEGLMPVLDRIIGLLSLLIIAWLWTYPTTNRLADAAAILLGLVLVALAAYALVWWQAQQPAETALYFNGSAADSIGGWVALAIILLGVFILVIRRPHGWALDWACCLAWQSGICCIGLLSRWSTIFPARCGWQQWPSTRCCWHYRSVSRFPVKSHPLPIVAVDQESPTFNQDPRAQQALVNLCLASSPKQFYQDLASTMAHLMTADICLLALPQLNERYLIFPGGYNLIADSKVDGFSLEQRKIPALVNALQLKPAVASAE